jgi:hypothetical protein
VALMISTALGESLLERMSLPIFTIGIALIVIAIVLQLLELQFSNRTLRLETEDIAAVRPLKDSDVPQTYKNTD